MGGGKNDISAEWVIYITAVSDKSFNILYILLFLFKLFRIEFGL